MTKTELAAIIESHKLWLRGEAEGARANLRGADLRGTDLRGVDLREADLIGANLGGADLRHADLRGADLSGANLSGANLSGADLSGTDLRGANLIGADLRGANLGGADLRHADLRGADLSGANLSGANLRGADLRGTDLSRANLSRANLSGADLSGAEYDDKTIWPDFQIVPEAGPFWLWKKLREGIVAQLEVPAEAARVSSTGRKCRVEYAKVLALYGSDGNTLAADAVGLSKHDGTTAYKVGEIVRPDKYDPDFRVECSSGIHGFLRRREAEDYA
jgi:hypothetical protein